MAATLILPRVELRLDTRQRTQISNYVDNRTPTAGELNYAAALRQKYPNAEHRNTAVCHTYNCHGLTFAGRRTRVAPGSEVRKILIEDGYQKIEYAELSSGDVVIYVSKETGDIEHSGFVIKKDAFGPWVLSKWGSAHEVVHRLGDSEYDPDNAEFYRIVR